MTDDLTTRMRQTASAVFLATEESIATDISSLLLVATTRLEAQQKKISELEAWADTATHSPSCATRWAYNPEYLPPCDCFLANRPKKG